MFYLRDKTYLLSANYDINKIDFISIFYLNNEGHFVFANIIDGNQLPNPELDITDFAVVYDGSLIVVADAAYSRLIYYKYTVYNEVRV